MSDRGPVLGMVFGLLGWERGRFCVHLRSTALEERSIDGGVLPPALNAGGRELGAAHPTDDRTGGENALGNSHLAAALALGKDSAGAHALLLPVGSAFLAVPFLTGDSPCAHVDLAGDAHDVGEPLDGRGVRLAGCRRERRAGQSVWRHRLDLQPDLLSGRPEAGVVIPASAGRVLDAARRVEAVRRFVEEDFEDLLGLEMQGLASEQHLAAKLTVGDPAAAPPVAEFDEPTPLAARAEDHDGIRKFGVVVADRPPCLLARPYDLAGGCVRPLLGLSAPRAGVCAGPGSTVVHVQRRLLEQLPFHPLAVLFAPGPDFA